MAKSSKKRKKTENRQTKKQLAFGRKEARQNRIILLGVGGLALLIVIILGVAVVQEVLVKPGQAVAMVDGSKIRADSFEALLTYQRYNQHMSIRNLESTLQEMDPDQEGSEFLVSFYEQQLAQLQSVLALAHESALNDLIDDELIRQEAEELGLAVTEEEVEMAIAEDIRQALAPPPQTPITDTEEAPAPTPIPQDELDAFLKNVLDNIGLTEEEFQTIVRRSLLRQKVQEQLANQVPTTGLVAHVQLIQTDTEGEAAEAWARIEGGEDFAIVAQEVSTDTLSAPDGGDLGWVAKDQLNIRYGQELEDAVFSTEVGEVTLVQSNDAYYVILVSERDENGPLPEQVLLSRQSSALDEWLAERKEGAEIERLLDPAQVPPDPFAAPLGF
jgi:parvulin-like peptidyl-prolyl isomerase